MTSVPDWSGAVAALRQADSVLLIAHVTPDPDALGSALALGLALRSLGKSVQVSVGEPGFRVPASLMFLPGTELVVSPENVVSPDVVVSCDTASIHRLGVLAEVVKSAPVSIVVDHHATNEGFGTINVVDATSPATASMVLKLVDLLDIELTQEIATLIYAGIATDTGSFKYRGTSSDTLRSVARLFDTGFDHTTTARLLFDDEPFSAVRMLGQAMSNAVLVSEAAGGRGLVYTRISSHDRGNLDELAMERVIDTLRRTHEAEVACVFKQTDEGVWKASLRSKTDISVGRLASEFGGGGHTMAAGYTGTTNVDAMVTDLLAALDRQVRQ